MILTTLLLLILPQEESKAKRIPGGTQQKYQGITFDLPKGWSTKTTSDGTFLVPEDANQGGIVEELYILAHDKNHKTIEGEGFDKAVEDTVTKLQPGVVLEGEPKKRRFGDLQGRSFLYRGETQDGRTAEVRVYAFQGSTCACVLVALGYADVLKNRNAQVSAILGSMSKAAAAKREEGTEEPPEGVKRISGGAMHKFKGVAYDLPRNWQKKTASDGVLVSPPGANQGGVVEELYFFAGDPSAPAVDSAEFVEKCDELVQKIQKNVERQGDPKKKKFGAVAGRLFTYEGEVEGRKIQVFVHAFQGTGSACVFVVLGYEDVLAKRRASVDAILASMWRPKSKAEVREELVGTWAYMKTFTANDRGGRTSYSQIVLREDGTYTWSGKTESWGTVRSEGHEPKPWSTGGSDSVGGTWVADDDSLTLTPEGGRPYTFVLEKRNHPKNVNDPMIVLDGVEYVTVYKKERWP